MKASQKYISRSASIPAILLLLLFLHLGEVTRAQVVANYNFSQTSGTYTSIGGGTLLFSGSFDDAVSGPISIPAFNYNGDTYTQMYVSTNGFLTFGSAPSVSTYTPLSSPEPYAGAVVPFGADLQSGASGTTNIRYRSIGYQLVVQWHNVRRAGEPESFSFQARLNRYTGVIQFIYGPITMAPSTSTADQPEVGLRGPTNSHANQVNNRRVTTGVHNWANSLPGNNNASTVRFTSSNPAKFWAPGQTYRYRNPGGGSGCEPPFVLVDVITDCDLETFHIAVDVETIGDAQSLTVSSVPAGGTYAGVADGVYLLGPYVHGTAVVVNVANDNNSNCGEQVSNVTNAVCDCENVPGGGALPGAPCDDGDACTINDTWEVGCVCVGSFQDSDVDGICDAEDECPFAFGEIGSPCDPGPGFVLGTLDANCLCVGVACTEEVLMEVNSDLNADQTTWEITDMATAEVLCSGGPYISGFQMNLTTYCCLPDGCFNLTVYDAGGDGMVNGFNGGYQLRLASDNRRIIENQQNGAFGSISAITGNAYGFCLPIGDDEPIYTSCDKYWWRTTEYVVCVENPAVSAVWVDGGSNSEQSANSGYEFWFYDPNGGYSFRRFRAHNVSDGYASVGATRTCHMRLNNWAVANHVPENKLMNLRIRGRIVGDNLPWGPACRFVRDEQLALCPPTKLMDIPGNQFLSCGQFRQWVTNQHVYARPIGGASQYQWRFRIEAENVEINRFSDTYILSMGWNAGVAPPLQLGKTYDVDVRAFRNGAWCVDPSDPDSTWGDVCQLTIGVMPSIQGGGQNMGVTSDAGFLLWPNPNEGNELRLQVGAIEVGVQSVAVDIHDLTGKRVVAREIPTTDRNLNTVIDLNGDLANGMYLVNITVGDKRYTERLVIAR